MGAPVEEKRGCGSPKPPAVLARRLPYNAAVQHLFDAEPGEVARGGRKKAGHLSGWSGSFHPSNLETYWPKDLCDRSAAWSCRARTNVDGNNFSAAARMPARPDSIVIDKQNNSPSCGPQNFRLLVAQGRSKMVTRQGNR